MKILICFSFLCIPLLSCIKKNNDLVIQAATLMHTDTSKTYLALGDSYTIGESVPADQRYPAQTANLLRIQNIDIKDPDIIAVTGWTTADLIDALNLNPPRKTYSVVSLLIGVNNQYQHKSLDAYKIEFTELLNWAISYAGNNKDHVFVISIPDYSVTPFASAMDTAEIARQIDNFNDANKKISQDAGVHYLDITGISRQAKNTSSLTASDGLHPSGDQYRLWSELLAPLMLAELH